MSAATRIFLRDGSASGSHRTRRTNPRGCRAGRRGGRSALEALAHLAGDVAHAALDRAQAAGLALALLLAGADEDERTAGDRADHDRRRGALPVARIAHRGQLPVPEVV